MAIIYNIVKEKDEYILNVSQDTSYVIKYIKGAIKELIVSNNILANNEKNLVLAKDGTYELTLSADGEPDVVETLKTYINLQKSIITDVLTYMCNEDSCYSNNVNCVSNYSKELLKVQNIFNKLLYYQHNYLPQFSTTVLENFSKYITDAINTSNCDFQNNINNIILQECIGDNIDLDINLFKSYLFLYWAGFYFTELSLIQNNDNNKEYVKEKYYYNTIINCFNSSCFNITELNNIYNTMITEIYNFQLDNINEDINDILNVNYNLNQIAEQSLLDGTIINFNKIARFGFLIKNLNQNPYKIYDIFGNDITNTFDYLFNNDISYYVSKEYISHSNIYFKFIKNF